MHDRTVMAGVQLFQGWSHPTIGLSIPRQTEGIDRNYPISCLILSTFPLAAERDCICSVIVRVA
jgi:hypothetical protein